MRSFPRCLVWPFIASLGVAAFITSAAASASAAPSCSAYAELPPRVVVQTKFQVLSDSALVIQAANTAYDIAGGSYSLVNGDTLATATDYSSPTVPGGFYVPPHIHASLLHDQVRR